MIVYLNEKFTEQVPSDLMQRWVLRSDLAPVPRTVEMTVQIKDGVNDGIEQRLKVGGFFWTGREGLKYEIVKTERNKAGVIQGRDEMAVITVHALLASCAKIAFRRQRAVIRDAATIGEIYRACGAEVAINDDFAVTRFACYTGEVPSFAVARVLQEEASVLVLRDKRVSLTRLDDLFKQTAKDKIGQSDTTDKVDSEFLERHEIPMFYSIDDDGNVVHGNFDKERQAIYIPRTSERVLRNLSKVLVTRRIVPSKFAPQINAGDVLEINGKKMAVITAAHWSERNDGITETNSKFWCGTLSV